MPADQLKPGDVVYAATDLTRAGDIVGSPLRVPDFAGVRPALASMDCVRIQPIEDRCEADFLYRLLMLPSVRRQMVALSAGSTVLHLETRRVPSILVLVPKERDVRRRIAAILTSLDNAIEATEALIEKHQQIKAGLMHDLFTRGLLPNGELRPPASAAPALYRQVAERHVPDKGLLHLHRAITTF